MNREELKKILEDNRKWLDGELGGEPAVLLGANLKGADLEGADLEGANLSRANLRGANLQNANLRGANLWSANLRVANLRGTDLRGADLRGADLLDACLRGADLQGAQCMVTIFANADLRGADLRGANLWRAYTDGMKTDTATKIDWQTECPETGSFIGWKKAGGRIVKLEIPEDAERSSATTKKCRASMARVLEIQNVDGTNADITMARSCWRKVYKPGEMVYPDKWDNNRWNECSHGIHFFMTRQEAVEW